MMYNERMKQRIVKKLRTEVERIKQRSDNNLCSELELEFIEFFKKPTVPNYYNVLNTHS